MFDFSKLSLENINISAAININQEACDALKFCTAIICASVVIIRLSEIFIEKKKPKTKKK